jgi:aerobic carbon-monoxide dehydrogenase large subunit
MNLESVMSDGGRPEDPPLLRGEGRFADNMASRRDASAHWAHVVRSPHAAARIERIDVAVARAMPGVELVMTGTELIAAGVRPIPFLPLFKRPDGTPMSAPARHALAVERVRHVGEAVAFVVARTREEARDAAEHVDVTYEMLPAITSASDAVLPNAPKVLDTAIDNVAAGARFGDAEATKNAFTRAAHVVRLDLVHPRVAAAPLETRASIATFDRVSGKLTLRTASQNPGATRKLLADDVLGMPLDCVRVLVGDIGGSFSVKTYLYPEDVLIAHAARMLNRAVRWSADRIEAFLSDNQGRDHVTHAELALDRNARMLGLRVTTLANAGAYLTPSAAIIPIIAYTRVLTNTYDIPCLDVDVQVVLTNTVPVLAHRGAGRPEAVYVAERLVDAAARALAIDPAEIRRRNLVSRASMPYRNAIGETYDDGDFTRMLDAALHRFDWSGFTTRRRQAERAGYLLGRGICSYVEWTGGANYTEPVEVRALGDGSIEALSGTQGMGQGIAGSYATLLAQHLDLPATKIAVIQGDTDRIVGGGSAGSRSLFVGGSAMVKAAETLLKQAEGLAATALEVAPADLRYANGRFTVSGTDRSITLGELATRDGVLVAKVSNTVQGPSWPNGCHVCEVEIDPDVGAVRITRYVGVDDVGRVVSPSIVEGQLHGGAAQGLGQALLEQIIYQTNTAQLLTGSFMDYALPRADDCPAFECELDTTIPCRSNPLGVKGAGEAGTVAAPAAIANAVNDALASRGVRELDMPFTSERIWRAINEQ